MTEKTFADFGIDIPSGARGEIDVLCPKCSHTRKKSRDKCLSVNVEKGTWYCQHVHCGWKDSLGRSTFPAYGDRLEKTYSAPRPIPEVVEPTLWEKAVGWFDLERGITEEILLRNNVQVADEYCPVCETNMSHVLFPYYRDGTHTNTKHRCVKKHFRMERNAERVFYGLDDINGTDTVVIVEGEIDKLSLEMAGYRNVLSVPDGAPPPDAKSYASKFSFLTSAETAFEHVNKFILAVDADKPGQKLLEELSRRLGPERCYRVTWPLDIKDANECLVKVGSAYLRDVIEAAEPFPVEGIITGAEIARDLEDLYDRGFDPGVGAGYQRFDQHYRVRTGLFTVITGVPSHGKSNFLDQLIVRLAERHGWTFAICSPENQPLVRHQAGIISKYAGKPFSQNGPRERMTKAEMLEASKWANEHFAFVLPEEPTLDAILDRAKTLVFRMGIKGLVIDPWNEIEHAYGQNATETKYISEALGKIRRFARHHNIHIWLVAHPTKMQKTEDKREAIPTMYDISGSAHFRNKADAGITVWRDLSDSSQPSQVHIQKVRFAETGQLGMVEFTYDPATGRYAEVSVAYDGGNS